MCRLGAAQVRVAATDAPDVQARVMAVPPAAVAATAVAAVAATAVAAAVATAAVPATVAAVAAEVPTVPAPTVPVPNEYAYMNSRIQITVWITIGALLLLGGIVFVGTQYVIPNLVDRQGGENATTTDASLVFLRSQYETAADIHSRLKSDNAAYAQANQLRRAEKYADAAKAYRAALADVTDVGEETEIRFWLAYSYSVIGNYAESIAIYKQLAAASTTLSRVTRAHAVQNLAHMYYRFGDPEITKEIFKTYPYKRFYNAKYIPLSYRNVFDYAASLYPLALAETYSAEWYANRLVAGTTTRPEYPDIVREKLRLAEKDLESVRNDASQRNTFMDALERRAVVLGKMRRTGDTSFADPEAAFKELLQYHKTFGIRYDGTARLQYAYYLAHVYGKDRAADIQNVLAPLVAAPNGRGAIVDSFLKNERLNRLGSRSTLARLAAIDPAFKQLLVSLGWTEKDFQTN